MAVDSQPMGTAIVQAWNAHARVVPGAGIRPLFRETSRAGLVVGTYAAVPYVHLQLEAWRRFYPGVPVLVHDDGSHKTADLQALCDRYGCDFEFNERRQPPTIGDLTVFLGGLLWARARGLDLLVKVSRRWLFLTDWVAGLNTLALESQYATFGTYTTTFNFGFRTECVGMAVGPWADGRFTGNLEATIGRGQGVFVEAYIHEHARYFERENGHAAEAWRRAHPMAEDRNGYALWTLLGTDRCERSPDFLWHDSCRPEEYHALALAWGLQYSLDDFADPNQGAGNGT